METALLVGSAGPAHLGHQSHTPRHSQTGEGMTLALSSPRVPFSAAAHAPHEGNSAPGPLRGILRRVLSRMKDRRARYLMGANQWAQTQAQAESGCIVGTPSFASSRRPSVSGSLSQLVDVVLPVGPCMAEDSSWGGGMMDIQPLMLVTPNLPSLITTTYSFLESEPEVPLEQQVLDGVLALPAQAPAAQASRVSWLGRTAARLRRVAVRTGRAVGSQLRPKTAGHNDRTLSEKLLNVVSCAPFLVVGRTTLRVCKDTAARRFGYAFLAVTGIAAAYHACDGRFKRVFRLLDQWSIALSSSLLTSAVYKPAVAQVALLPAASRTSVSACCAVLTRWAKVANMAIIPFNPVLISGVNLLLVEAQCLRMALRSKRALLKPWVVHSGLGGIASTCFIAEDLLVEQLGHVVPGMHATWHLLSAASIVTILPFINHL